MLRRLICVSEFGGLNIRSYSIRSVLANKLSMDVASLASRLNGLELSQAGSKDVGARLSSFFFTPKTGSKHPDDNSKDLKVVVACLEDTRSVGASKALAGTVGLKDMRAISATDLKSLIGRSREEGEFNRAFLPRKRFAPNVLMGQSVASFSAARIDQSRPRHRIGDAHKCYRLPAIA